MMSVGKQIKVIKRAGQRKSRPHNIEETQSVAMRAAPLRKQSERL
jgi:hypothetical protein